MNGDYKITVGVRSIIIKGGRVLLVQQTNRTGRVIYLLPGGGVHNQEDIRSAVVREVMEETTLEVEPKDIWFVREMISQRGTTYEFIFGVEVIHGEARLGFDPEQAGLEPKLKGLVYYPIDTLEEIELYPTALKKLIPLRCQEKFAEITFPVFLEKEIFT